MSKWEKASLDKVTVIMTDGDWIESKDQSLSGVRLIQTGNIGEGMYIDKPKNAKFVSEDTFHRLKCTELFEGDVLISRLPSPVGRACLVPNLNTKMITAVDCSILRFDEHRVVNKFFVYYSMSQNYLKQIEKHLVGSTRVRISRKNLQSIFIPLPPSEVQQQIVSTLDAASELLTMHKQQLAELDELIKSVFNEMFGDLAFNKKNWDREILTNLCKDKEDIKCGPFGTQLNKSEYQSYGVPILGIPQVNSGFSLPASEYLSEEKAYQLDNYSIVENDITMSRKGNVGKCALYPPGSSKGIMHSDVLRIRVNNELINPIFLLQQFHISRFIHNEITLVSSGAIMAGINVTKLKNAVVHVPPLDLQNKFADIVTKIEEQKALVKQAIDETQQLFDSLMSQYFDD